MQIAFHLLLLLAVFIVIINGQGARGGSRGGGSSSRYRGSGSRGSTCSGAGCQKAGIIAGSVIGGVLLLAAILFLVIYCYRRYRRNRTSESNTAFVNKTSTDGTNRSYHTYEDDHFRNGTWQSQYHQYGKWHGPHQMSLTFDHITSRVSGYGLDDVGKFNVNGTFSFESPRITLNKIYELGTGNSRENFGHVITMQLEWNSNNSQFEGKWFIRTPHYSDDDKFQLKFVN